ncbi:MAG: photosynthetic reaction center subunit H [Pseudomonadota bacterium]
MFIFDGEFVQGVDLVDVCLWAFTIFFLGLIYYLQRESSREGYPIEDDVTGKLEKESIFFFPPKKTYKLPHGRGTIERSYGPADTRDLALKRAAPWGGSPFLPTGDPMVDGVGPASYAMREDVPDLTDDGRDRISPFRLNPEYTVPAEDFDPRGHPIVGADRAIGGTVVDLWVDRSEAVIRYFEVEVDADDGIKSKILVPVPFCSLSKKHQRVEVEAVLGEHFKAVPKTKSADSVTRLEEDMISGYFGGGTLYATPERQEPLL